MSNDLRFPCDRTAAVRCGKVSLLQRLFCIFQSLIYRRRQQNILVSPKLRPPTELPDSSQHLVQPFRIQQIAPTQVSSPKRDNIEHIYMLCHSERKNRVALLTFAFGVSSVTTNTLSTNFVRIWFCVEGGGQTISDIKRLLSIKAEMKIFVRMTNFVSCSHICFLYRGRIVDFWLAV